MNKVVCINQKGWVSDPFHTPMKGPSYEEICQPVKEVGGYYILCGYGDLEYPKSLFVDLISDYGLNVYANCEIILNT